MYTATVMLIDGKAAVAETDDVIHVTDALWQEITTATGVDERLGHATVVDEVLSFGTDGEGLGRVYYQFVKHDVDDAGHHVRVFRRDE